MQKNRFSLDIDDIRERIENVHSEKVWWNEMSLAAKIRTLIIERLDQLEREKKAAKK
jgi:hypothetical protein